MGTKQIKEQVKQIKEQVKQNAKTAEDNSRDIGLLKKGQYSIGWSCYRKPALHFGPATEPDWDGTLHYENMANPQSGHVTIPKDGLYLLTFGAALASDDFSRIYGYLNKQSGSKHSVLKAIVNVHYLLESQDNNQHGISSS